MTAPTATPATNTRIEIGVGVLQGGLPAYGAKWDLMRSGGKGAPLAIAGPKRQGLSPATPESRAFPHFPEARLKRGNREQATAETPVPAIFSSGGPEPTNREQAAVNPQAAEPSWVLAMHYDLGTLD